MRLASSQKSQHAEKLMKISGKDNHKLLRNFEDGRDARQLTETRRRRTAVVRRGALEVSNAADGLLSKFLPFGEDLVLIGELKSHGKDDLSFGVHPAVFSGFYPVYGEGGETCLSGQFCLTHQLLLAELPDVVLFGGCHSR